MVKAIKTFTGNILDNMLIRGSKRTKTVKSNAYLSLVIMIANNLVGILFIPVVIGMIEPIRYGIWITVNSVLHWFNLANLGLGGGLRTRLSLALASGDKDLAKRYISTGYAFLCCVVLLVVLVFLFVQRYINWALFFNAPSTYSSELRIMMIFVFMFFMLRLVMQLINNILVAFQKVFLRSLINFVGHLATLITIYVVFLSVEANLFLLGVIYTLTPVLILFVASIIVFSKKLKQYRPRISHMARLMDSFIQREFNTYSL